MVREAFAKRSLFIKTLLPGLLTAALTLPGGAKAQEVPPDDPSLIGDWSSVKEWPVVPITMMMLPTGKVMFFPGWDGSGDDPRLWNPATDKIEELPKVGYDIFCSGHSFLADGRLLVTGGHIDNDVGLAYASIYDPFKNSWTRLPDMNAGRWYPTNTTLANGDVLVVGGNIDLEVGINMLPQVFEAATNTWRDLKDAELELPYYPFMFLAPNGKVFYAGPTTNTQYLNTEKTGEWTDVARSIFGYRDYGSAVLYETGKILLAGGHDVPTNTAELIDLNQSAPKWRKIDSMETARRQMNATVLPDGKVLVTGGSSGKGFNNEKAPVFTAEMWDPMTEKWTTMASAVKYRGYHSTALLLPDGRVLTGGGNYEPNVQIYSPPYLFKGDRPGVKAAPTTVKYGEEFAVDLSEDADIAKVSWVRPGAVTHAFDQDQRFQSLKFTKEGTRLMVKAPAFANIAPPGYYMLFLVNSEGVPSKAKFVQIGGPSAPPPPAVDLNPPYNLWAEALVPGEINLYWKDGSANESGFKIERSTNGTKWTQIALNTRNETEYVDKSVGSKRNYQYRVRATNDKGDSAYSDVVKIRSLPAAKITLCGDVDDSGAVNVEDAVKVFKHILNVELLTADHLSAADTNMDDQIDVNDVVKMLRIATALDPPCEDMLEVPELQPTETP